MQNEMNNKERPDAFSDIIRKKLEDHRLPVDADCWNEIELHLKPKNKNRRIIGWIGSAVAAVAVIILLVTSLPEGNSPSDIADILPKIDSTDINKVEKSQSKEIIKHLPDKNITHTQQGKRELPSDNKKEVKENTIIILEDSLHLANNNTTGVNDISSDTISPSYIAKEETKEIEKEPKRTIQEEKIILPKTKGNDKWLLAASVSSSGGISSKNASPMNNYGPVYNMSTPNLAGSDPVAVPNLTLKYGEDEHTDYDHSLPLSFGVSVRKNINNRIGIETGIVYTYLSSKFKKSSNPDHRAKQELHYLGVPLNLVVYLLNDSKWNVYVSGGGMAEKGLRYKYTEDASKSNNFLTDIKEKGSVDGMQWSINGAIGVSYSLTDDWGLYFEPKVSHYFDNDQPVSIRTDKKTVFGLSGGLRYEF